MFYYIHVALEHIHWYIRYATYTFKVYLCLLHYIFLPVFFYKDRRFITFYLFLVVLVFRKKMKFEDLWYWTWALLFLWRKVEKLFINLATIHIWKHPHIYSRYRIKNFFYNSSNNKNLFYTMNLCYIKFLNFTILY